ncbi:MAG: hypothetical protein JW884_10525 [Deltaproteobacteria bacterium]|nr:hypothetical protein [Deltaproteobacteria bacterium]
MVEFSDNHRRVLANSFRYVDKRLTTLETKLGVSGQQSPFHKLTMDLSPAQKRMVITHIALIQEAMLKFLEDQEIPLRQENTSIWRCAKTTTQFLQIIFEELRPNYLRGYGALPETAARELNEFVTNIQELLGQMNDELS